MILPLYICTYVFNLLDVCGDMLDTSLNHSDSKYDSCKVSVINFVEMNENLLNGTNI